ncbi:MAG TPA: GNAT family N-acetyltransferase [Gemmatimonadaceae bacterium]|nr:GNAT family N-acetyltransferase [Gemmatimonadaceae bacterium]
MRRESEQDLAFVERLYASVRAEELRATGWPEDAQLAFVRQQLALQREHYRNHFPATEFMIVTRRSAPIGRLYLSLGQAEYRVLDLSLVAESRGRGIGGELVRTIQAAATRAGCPVTLHVERGSRARRLYDRAGFLVIRANGAYDLMRWSAGGDDKRLHALAL